MHKVLKHPTAVPRLVDFFEFSYMLATSKLFTMITSTTASRLQQLHPGRTQEDIETNAALLANIAATEARRARLFKNKRTKYPFNLDYCGMEQVEVVDTQELLSFPDNFSDGNAFEADLFIT
jgi:hypothetical protein